MKACRLALIAFFAANTAAGQSKLSLSGIVRDSGGNPLQSAEVSVDETARVWTNEKGEFTLSNLKGGTLILSVRRVGYVPVARELTTLPDVTNISLEIALVPNAQKLGTVVIEGKTLDQALVKMGYYRRKEMSGGIFFDGPELTRSAAPISTMVTAFPSMRLDTSPGSGALRVPVARAPDGLSFCPISVYLDGQYLPWAHDVGVDNIVSKSDIRAMELYTRESRMTGAMFGKFGKTIMNNGELKGGAVGGGTAACGALYIWTKYFDG